MRRIWLGLFIAFLVCSTVRLSYAQDNANASKTLIVYYSRDGHTKLVAEKLAQKFAADSEVLIDKKKRTGLWGASSAGKDALSHALTKIAPLTKDPRDYDRILIGTPSWFSNVTPAVRTFVKKYDLSGKKVGVFATAHQTGVESCLAQLAMLIESKDPASIPRLPLRHRDLKEDVLAKKIDLFYDEIMGK